MGVWLWWLGCWAYRVSVVDVRRPSLAEGWGNPKVHCYRVVEKPQMELESRQDRAKSAPNGGKQ